MIAPPVVAEARRKPAVNWEQFMGAKLFAWLGGLALLLGVAFFVKYSFEHNLVPPEVRVAIGFALGAAFIVVGLRLIRRGYTAPAQSLVAAGIVSLYAVTFACNSIYHFAFFGPIPTFLLMVLITTAAFALAVRLEAQVVAILGLLGGFLTPVLISSGHDNPPGLFGYIALLDVGLAAVALRRRWHHLVPLSAGGTVVLMIAWSLRFFTAAKGPTAMTVCLGFGVLYLAVAEFGRRRSLRDRWITATAAAMPLVGLAFGWFFLDYPELAARAPLYLGYLLLVDGLLLRLAWTDETLPRLHLVAGLVTFALFATWTGRHLTVASLPWALAGDLGFAALHTVVAHLIARRRPAIAPVWWSQLFPPLTLLLLLLPLIKLDAVSLLLWPAMLVVDGLAIAAALAGASLLGVAAVLVLTLLGTALCVFKVPAGLALEPSLLLVIGGVAVFFFVAARWLAGRMGDRLTGPDSGRLAGVLGDARTQLPAFSSLLPFLLLVMICERLAVPDPSLVFGLGLLLVVLALGLGRWATIEWLPLCALAGMTAVEFAWHLRHFDAAAPGRPLGWYLVFHVLFASHPFVFRRAFRDQTGPWAVAALSGLAAFGLVYRLVQASWPNDVMGLLPALFALPPLLSLTLILRTVPVDAPRRLNQLAWFGGTALAFITFVFPVQFDRQWLTVAWALEGTALLWLFHRVPHPGLRAVGIALLATAFVRLALNPAVLSYHARGPLPLLNWYLYAYGLVIVALATGTRLLGPERVPAFGSDVRAWLPTFAVVLGFLLLNLEIADFFATPGDRVLAFRFRGNFARDMTYTIAWALFALGLLAAGIWKRQAAARYAALGLLSAALLKLFLHDLARLEALYRIGALFAVAVIAIVASFAYQRFLPSHETPPSPAS